ncbi:anthranilate synthase component I family protein [Aegicerativicinus sediminis]|uniref:anthranilate synthase component I family protein n=1 Tax=Aegicerativicinus sediminis TaxID=2893202 RepID=UPI001E3B3479|nr:anthranilate synthase component I family protein [Aegicerativicinus sediminis]
MATYHLKTHYTKVLADTLTPVSVYLKIRDRYPNSILLESSDYHTSDNSFSYICCNPIASIELKNDELISSYPDGTNRTKKLSDKSKIVDEIQEFVDSFAVETLSDFKFIYNGIFGYTGYDTVRYFEDVTISKKIGYLGVPDLIYSVYQNIIAINHFKNEAYVFAHCYNTEDNLDALLHLIQSRNYATFNFRTEGETTSNLTDEEFLEHVALAKKHCARGDVFQLVLSRKFSKSFKGDEFNVYRALRSINPSPYLFYFDYGNFKIFGSSPEAQLIVANGKTEIHPIAGTFKRTGNDEQDATLARQLSEDEKENSEHVMLVDLARNDLSRNGRDVKVETYREVQFFSHVIHLVSKVTGFKNDKISTMQVVADTFPAGTLSGAPKHMALQLIERYEKTSREFYGGAIGFMDFHGNFNHAIMIRTFLSKNHELHWQAGAGMVSESKPENELQEVYNKLGALNKAIELAQSI